MSFDLPSMAPRRIHVSRLMSIWRSAGWPCRDSIELDLIAAGWAALVRADGGHETLQVTALGLRVLAEARERRSRAISAHDRLVGRVCQRLLAEGRIVWRELSLRTRMSNDAPPANADQQALDIEPPDETSTAYVQTKSDFSWRSARPDVFSIRQTSVEDYLLPMVHEVKVSRADLMSDLRNAPKRASYQALACEAYYVFPADVAAPEEIPEPFGVWRISGPLDTGAMELTRPAHHVACRVPFHLWMALAKATPVERDEADLQGELAERGEAQPDGIASQPPSEQRDA